MSSLVWECLHKKSEPGASTWRLYWFCLVISLGEEGDDSLKWIFSNNGLPFLAPGTGTELQRKRESVTWVLVGRVGERNAPRSLSEEGTGVRGPSSAAR